MCQKVLGTKHFMIQKIWTAEHLGFQKILCSKNFFVLKKIWVPKNFRFQKNLGPKNFCHEKLCVLKNLGYERFWFPKQFGSQKFTPSLFRSFISSTYHISDQCQKISASLFKLKNFCTYGFLVLPSYKPTFSKPWSLILVSYFDTHVFGRWYLPGVCFNLHVRIYV